MPVIVPVRDLKNTTMISELCHKENRPVFVTKNGYGDMVVMSMEHYQECIGRYEIYAKLAELKDYYDKQLAQTKDNADKQIETLKQMQTRKKH